MAFLALLASLVATVVGARFCVALFRRWDGGGRRRPALLHWTISTGMFALASLMLFLGELIGWSSPSFRIFYLFGAVLNVPWLALGSVLVNSESRTVNRATGITTLVTGLLFVPGAASGSGLAWAGALLGLGWGLILLVPTPAQTRRWSVALVLAFGVLSTLFVLGAGLQADLPAGGIPEGKELFAPLVRGFAVGGNAVGALIVVVGAVTSALAMSWEHTDVGAREDFTRGLRSSPVEAMARMLFTGNRAAREAGLAHLAAGNLLIALGVLLAAGSGGMFSFLGDTAGHAIGLGGGVAIMYAGFQKTLGPMPAAADAAAHDEAARS